MMLLSFFAVHTLRTDYW